MCVFQMRFYQTRVDAQGASFDGASLLGSSFIGANLRGASAVGCSFTVPPFRSAAHGP